MMNQNLNSNYSEEKPINFVNLIFYVLRKWRVMLVVAVLAAIATAAFTYSASIKEAQEDIAKKSKKVELPEEYQDSYQVKADAIEEHLKNVEEYNYYLENSIKMKLDPNQYYSGTAKYLVAADNHADKLKALHLCEEKVFADEELMELSEKLQENPEIAFLKEVITLSESSDISGASVVMSAQDVNKTVLVVTVQHYEKEECQKMLEHMMKKIEGMQESLSSKGVQAYFENITSDVKTAQNNSLVGLSEEIQTKKVNAYDAIKEIEKDMSSKEEKYYEAVKDGETEGAEEIENPEIKGTINWIYVIAAMIGAAFITAGISALVYLFSDRIRSKDEVEEMLSVPVMTFSGAPSKNRVDEMLRKLEKRFDGLAEDEVEMTAVMLKKIAAQHDVKSIYISGSQGLGNVEDTVLKLKELLSAEKIELSIGNSVLKDSKTLKDAIDCGYVVFLERRNRSLGKDIRSEVSKVNSCGGEILGVILQQ